MTLPSRIVIVIIGCLLLHLSAASDRPIIGILTLPQCRTGDDPGHCIVASYVKYVESAGARVVPIPFDLGHDELYHLLSQLNGVLLTGGSTLLQEGTPFFDTATSIYNFTLESNRNGNVFPLIGICQGFEVIASVVSSTSILKAFSANNLSLPLDFVYGSASSQMFPDSRPEWEYVYNLLESQPITYHEHSLGVATDDFRSSLANNFKLIAVNNDQYGREFVSAFEGLDSPIFALIFHPEKQLFEWSRRMGISHSSEAVFANRYFADVFVDVARQSNRSFPTIQDEDDHLIYNYRPVFTGAHDSYYEQIYYITPKYYISRSKDII